MESSMAAVYVISFDRPAITSGKKIVALDEVSVMVLAMVSVIDKWTTTASSPSRNRHGPILHWRQAFLGISNKFMGPEPVTFSTRDLTYMILCEDNNGHKGAQTTWVPAGEGQNKGTQIWANGRLHAMLVFCRFGASILYNINWARGLTYICSVDVRMDMMHVGYSEKLAGSSMSSTTTSATVGDGLSTARLSYSSLDSSCMPEAVGTAVSCEHRSRFGQHVS